MVVLLRWPNSGLIPELDSCPRVALQRTNVVTADTHQCSPASWNLWPPPGKSQRADPGDSRLVAAQGISPPFRTGYLPLLLGTPLLAGPPATGLGVQDHGTPLQGGRI